MRIDRFLPVQRQLPRAYLRGTAGVVPRCVESARVPAARGFRLCDQPIQLHSDRRQPDDVPVLMGCTVVWKPASTAMLSAYYTMKLLEEAGLPPGVINLVYGPGAKSERRARVSRPCRRSLHRLDVGVSGHLAGDRRAGIERYRNYPRIVGETGGKDFVLAHPSADSTRSRLPSCAARSSTRAEVLGRLACLRPVESLARAARPARGGNGDDQGRRRRGLHNFMGAVIDESSLDTQREAIEEARTDPDRRSSVGGSSTTRSASS